MTIPFNKPYLTGNEQEYIAMALKSGQLSGDGDFTQKCHLWLENYAGCEKALLTHSCTAALEMAAILADINPGDEVIMPSYTFVSTANAFVLRGGIPVFVDIQKDTLNIDPNLIEAAITPKTRAIVVVHYAGVACEMDAIMEISERHNLIVIEDAAQALMSEYKNKKLGSIGHLATYSFHDTKNIISGEGGALIINDPKFIDRAEIIREKGTNRKQFMHGRIDKYNWVDLGSSFLPSEVTAAFLCAQLEQAQDITDKRLKIWNQYFEKLTGLTKRHGMALPSVPKHCQHNAHMFYVLLPSNKQRQDFIAHLTKEDIRSVFHYIPLHSSPYGKNHSNTHSELNTTKQTSDRIARLPLWIGIEQEQDLVINAVLEYWK